LLFGSGGRSYYRFDTDNNSWVEDGGGGYICAGQLMFGFNFETSKRKRQSRVRVL
jgi:hypothetical protein